MKRINILSVIATSALLLTGACSSDEPIIEQTGQETNVSFNVTIPEKMQNNAKTIYGDGTTAQVLSYAVYRYDKTADDYVYMYDVTGEEINISTTVNLKLYYGDKYKVAFWAASATSPYDFDAENKTVTVDYTNAVCNDENRDAFFKTVEFTASINGSSKTVGLTRPFAQVNVGTDDLEDAAKSAFVPEQTQLKVNSYDQFNILTGEVSNTTSSKFRTFAYAPCPGTGETFPVSGYKYLAMTYVLVGDDQETSSVYFNVTSTDGRTPTIRTFSQVPLRRNHRTNIYGSLLTSENNFTVDITPGFDLLSDSDAVEAALQEEGAEVNLDPNSTITLPNNIADNVTINGNGASVLINANSVKSNAKSATTAKDVVYSANNLTIDNVVLKTPGYRVYITGENFTLKNSQINPTTPSASDNGITIANIALAENVTATFDNVIFNGASTVNRFIELYNGSKVILNGCDFSEKTQYVIYSRSECQVEAKDCTFRGWMSGWHNGATFENCTFALGAYSLPYAICYGSTTFTNCKFTWIPEGTVPTGYMEKYTDSYRVSGRGPVINFNGCKWISEFDEGHNNVSVDSSVYLPGQGDDKTWAQHVYIDGVEQTYTSDAE